MRNVLRNVSSLTALACERLKRGSLGDPTHRGLRIMARPSGAKVWIYRFRDPAGKMAQLLIGSFPALSLADASAEWRNHRAIRDKHGDPRDDVRRLREAATLQAMRGKGYTLTRAAESYRKEHLSKLARGGEQWRILEREILPEIGHVLLADLKPSQYAAWGSCSTTSNRQYATRRSGAAMLVGRRQGWAAVTLDYFMVCSSHVSQR